MASTDADKPIDETLVDCCGITVMPKRDGMTVANFFYGRLFLVKPGPGNHGENPRGPVPRGDPLGFRATPRGWTSKRQFANPENSRIKGARWILPKFAN